MFDQKWIRENPEAFDAGLARRGLAPRAAAVLELDARRRAVVAETQALQQQRNETSKRIGAAKGRGEDAQDLIDSVADLKARVQEGEAAERAVGQEIDRLLAVLPNLPAADVPDGADETANVELRKVGKPRRFGFEPRAHFDIGEALGHMDFEAAARMSGARFVALSGPLARLERALAAFMLDLQTLEHGYREVSPPLMLRDDAMFGTGQLPKFAEDSFQTKDGYWLLPTAEVPLTNLVREQILDGADLPLRRCAYTPCFRAEAGAAGKDTRGMIRMHQFPKVELVSITTAEASEDELERMTGCAEEVLKRLGLAYQVVLLSAGDMGFSARKTYDLEVWLPGQGRYREISSCSNCGDFQARRMGTRYRPDGAKGTRFVHTLNGSGLAVGRTMVAVIETYQNADGTITVPEVLRPHMGGIDLIGPRGAADD
ncbi:MAG: serine--tRNA ligase [Alphaproteobacteria bacterium]|jgi:seryl-tRNA synthetase|nr:serine--tRNA ligase [Alphaproteobacteria bacterium]MDP6517985.1 serine--tRNA ligase [Alphaproteobacteria bacterium]